MADFEFPQELAEKIREGQRHGVSEENMVKGIVSIGNLLKKFVQPDSPEEALMIQMWDNATPEEKETIARIIVRIGKKQVH